MKITRAYLRRLIREERDRLLKEAMSSSNDEIIFRRAVDDFIMDHMNTMQMNAGNPSDRERIRNQVLELVNVQIEALGLGD